tara:strand:- start:1168 stop:3237 length:2070 start_codon:yes stop_codon:yes gene_type:complete
MPVHPNDFSLSADQLRQRYTYKELEETAKLLKTYGESRYKNNFMELTAPDPGKMDVFSSEYASAVASNIIPSTLSMFTGLAEMVFNPIDTAEAMYELGLEGAVEGLKSQYDSWENAKRTFAKDPVGTLGMVAPGLQALGAAGKVAGVGRLAGKLAQGASAARAAMPALPSAVSAVTSPMGGLIGGAAKAIGKPALNMAVDPVGAVSRAAFKGAKSMMTGGGVAGRIGLEFITGESVQALESMQRSGRLTQAQMKTAGLNPFHWMGRFDDAEKAAEFGTTASQHFRRARKEGYELNGMRDEFAIIGHLDSVVLKSQNIILAQTKEMLDDVFGWWDNVTNDDLVTWLRPGGKLADADVGKKIAANLSDDLSDMGITFSFDETLKPPTYVHDITKPGTVLTGIDVDGLVNWIKTTLNNDWNDVNHIKNVLIGNDLTPNGPQAGFLQKLNQYKNQAGNSEIINAFYNAVRKHIDDITPKDAIAGVDEVLPKVGELYKVIDDPAFADNPWGKAMKMQKFREDIDKDYISMKNGKSDDAAMLNNYIRTLRDGDKGIKKQLIDELETLTGESVHAPIAGLIARKITPSSLVARGSAVSAMHKAAAMVAGSAILNPTLLFFIPLASPRFVGTMLNTIGLSQRSADYVKALTRHIGKHPVGKVLNASDRTIWSMGTALDRIQAYNAAQMQQPQLEERY